MYLTPALALVFHAALFSQAPCPIPPVPGGAPLQTKPGGLHGLYTDKPSYGLDEPILVYGNWGNQTPTYKIYKLGGTQRGAMTISQEHSNPQLGSSAKNYTLPAGSFVDFRDPVDLNAGLTLGGRSSFTVEGWFYPNFLFSGSSPTQDIVIAGQIGPSDAESVAGIGIRAGTNKVYALANTDAGLFTIESTQPALIGKWNYVAMTYTNGLLKLYHHNGGSVTPYSVNSVIAGGLTDTDASFFRLGANLKAPGNLTGCFSGKLDRWTVSSQALTGLQVVSRFTLGASPYPPLMACDFDEPYGTGSFQIGTGHPGTIVNHGSPGHEGVTGTALTICHDQIVDARFDLRATFIPPPSPSGMNKWEPGLYVAAAEFPFAFDSPRKYQAFVVRPSLLQQQEQDNTQRIAVIIPVFTWMAYSAWPGYNGEERKFFTASGLVGRQVAGTHVPQGTNSVYEGCGDGTGRFHYFSGWRRPNLSASPVVATGAPPIQDFKLINTFHCPANYDTVKWLEGNDFNGKYDVYTDLELHQGQISLTGEQRYGAVVLSAHTEYWTEPMLDNINAYVRDGGNILSAAGNSMMWRCDVRTRPADELAMADENLVLEVRRWPVFEHNDIDSMSWFSTGERAGAWRFLEQTSPPDQMRDLILGTRNDIVGGMCVTDANVANPLIVVVSGNQSQYGTWNAQPVPDLGLWGWTFSTSEVLCGPSMECRYVGHETDTFLPMYMKPDYIGDRWELASGENYGTCPDCRAQYLDYTHAAYSATTPADAANAFHMNSNGANGVLAGGKYGSICYYRYKVAENDERGRVLVVGSQNAVASLFEQSKVKDLAKLALECFLTGNNCPP